MGCHGMRTRALRSALPPISIRWCRNSADCAVLMLTLHLSRHPMRAKLDLQFPSLAISLQPFTAPVTGVVLDLAVGPANRRAVREFSFLDDIALHAARNEVSPESVV